MSPSSLAIVVVSRRSLIRELLGEVLRTRCAQPVLALCATLDEALAHPEANVAVWDVNGVGDDLRATALARLHVERPALRVVTIDDSVGQCGVDDIVRAVLAADWLGQLPHETLTPLESEVILAVAAGQRNSDIARRMRRSSKTVEKHRANAMRKLGLRTVAQLTAYALRTGLLDAATILDRR
jgi:DNA-binding CsgD family transcriptional regulator